VNKFNQLRNKTIDATVRAITKAKAKPESEAKKRLRELIEGLEPKDQLAAVNFVAKRIEEKMKCSN
jgi:hypothetical protein